MQMHMYRPIEYMPFNSETVADAALAEGRVDLAKSILTDAMSTRYDYDAVGRRSRIALKLAVMPLYELLNSPQDISTIDVVRQTVYDSVANEVNEAMQRSHSSNQEVMRMRIGDVSEGVFLGASIRAFDLSTGQAMLPASQVDDRFKKIDFVVHNIRDINAPRKSYQVKTKLAEEPHVIDGVMMMGINHLDPQFSQHRDHDSLANCLIREHEGIASSKDIDKLDEITQRIKTFLDEPFPDN